MGILLFVVGGLLGLYLTRRYRAEALILVSMAVGTEIVVLALGLDMSRSYTAVIALSLALVGVVMQYADYLREIKAVARPVPPPHPDLLPPTDSI